MQFGMLRYMRLNKHCAARRIKSGGEPVNSDVERILFDPRSVAVVGGERVPIGNKEETFVLILHPDPIVERADKITQVQLSGGAHTAEDSFAWRVRGGHQTPSSTASKIPMTG